MGPKTLQRLLRFQLVLEQVQRGLGDRSRPGASLARLAADAGYFDQPHLVHECVRLTGLTPTSFIEQTAARCGVTHDHSAAFSLLQSR
jgi:AraC-like DNA-binding protein